MRAQLRPGHAPRPKGRGWRKVRFTVSRAGLLCAAAAGLALSAFPSPAIVRPRAELIVPERKLIVPARREPAVRGFLPIFAPMKASSAGAGGDPSFSSVVALLHMDGTDASTTFTDVKGHTFTAAGNAQIDTAQSKFGGASGLFDGAGDRVTSASSVDWNLGGTGTGNDFTIEYWVRFNSTAGTQGHVTASDGGSSGWQVYTDGTKLYLRTGPGPPSVNWTPSANTWYYVTLVRSGTTCTFYVDGTSLGTVTNQDMNNDSRALSIGDMDGAGSSSLNGWIDDLRITKGVARYTSNFSPPTAAHPDS